MKMIPSNIEAVIFDFDGVIVDTEEIGIDVSSRLMKRRFGIKLTQEEKNMFYGLQDLRFYQLLIEKRYLEANPHLLLQYHNQEYDKAIMQINSTLPGVVNLLEELRKNGIVSAICSGSYISQIETVLRNLGLGGYFDVVTSCEETTNHKPNPEPYVVTAKKLKISPLNCAAIEDSENGVISAKNAGMYCVGVTVGNHGTQNLVGADMVIYSLTELKLNSRSPPHVKL